MSTIESRELDRRMLEEEVERFLKSGGKIREIETGVSNDVIDYWGETNNPEHIHHETANDSQDTGVGVHTVRP